MHNVIVQPQLLLCVPHAGMDGALLLLGNLCTSVRTKNSQDITGDNSMKPGNPLETFLSYFLRSSRWSDNPGLKLLTGKEKGKHAVVAY